MGLVVIIFFIVVLYLLFLIVYYAKKKTKKNPVASYKNPPYHIANKSLMFDFSINKLEINNDCLNITILLHNFTDKPVTIELKNAFYVSAKTRTQYKGDCTRLVYQKLGEKPDLDNMILPGLNIKRDIAIYKYDQKYVNEKDILIAECLINGNNILLKNSIN